MWRSDLNLGTGDTALADIPVSLRMNSSHPLQWDGRDCEATVLWSAEVLQGCFLQIQFLSSVVLGERGTSSIGYNKTKNTNKTK